MNELEREDETVDVEIYEGEPDFDRSQGLEDGLQDDDSDDVKVDTDLGQALGGETIPSGQPVQQDTGPVPPEDPEATDA